MNLKSIIPLKVTEALGLQRAEADLWYPDGDHCASVHGNLGTMPEPIDPLELAQLLAAAPELAEAARLTLHILDDLTTRQFQRGEDKPARDSLRAALKKAGIA